MDSQMKKCPLCDGNGESLYAGLRDYLYETPGRWSLMQCRNASCGLLWLEPRPTDKELRLAYQSYYTHENNTVPSSSSTATLKSWIINGYLGARYGYKRETTSFIQRIISSLVYLLPALRQRFDMRVRKLSARECGRVLDIGCGSGEWLQYMQNFGVEVQGLEVDPRAANVARSRGLPVHIGPLENAGFSKHAFDTVTLSHVIEHVASPQDLLQQCNRILRPGGLLVVTTPNSSSFGHRIFGQHWRGLEPPRHLHLLNQKNLRTMVETAGCAVMRCETFAHSDSIVRQSLSTAMRARRAHAPSSLPLWGRLCVRLLSMLEICALPLRPQLGEEIYLKARKIRDVEASIESQNAFIDRRAEANSDRKAVYG